MSRILIVDDDGLALLGCRRLTRLCTGASPFFVVVSAKEVRLRAVDVCRAVLLIVDLGHLALLDQTAATAAALGRCGRRRSVLVSVLAAPEGAR